MRSAAIIETLRKLIEHEKSASAIGNFAEAEAFAEKFQKLMEAHNLTMADLGWESLNIDVQDDYETSCSTPFGRRTDRPKRRQSWQEVLGSTVEGQKVSTSH